MIAAIKDPESYKEYASNILYKILISADKAQEFSTELNKLKRETKSLAKKEIKIIADLFGLCLEFKMRQIKKKTSRQNQSDLTQTQNEKMIEACIKQARREYKKRSDEAN